MFHQPRYWTTRIPQSLFEQTLYETDEVFYATFPAARDALDLGQNDDCSRYTNCWTLHEERQPLEYDIRSEQEMDISSPSVPFSLSKDGPTQEISCPPLHYDYSKVHAHQSPFSLRQDQLSYYSSPPPSPPSPGPDHIYIQESIDDGSSREDGFRQLNRHMKPPTVKFTNNCQLAVMRLDRLAKESSPIDCSLKKDNDDQLCGGSSRTDIAPTEFLLNSPKSPSIGLSSLPSNSSPQKKPLSCFFCRRRKIVCGPPLPGSISKTCSQCRKRSLQCHFPSESRRGMRKKKTSE